MGYIRVLNQKVMLVALLLFGLFMFSCSVGKQGPIDQLERLTEDIREHHDEYSVMSLDGIKSEIKGFVEGLDKSMK